MDKQALEQAQKEAEEEEKRKTEERKQESHNMVAAEIQRALEQGKLLYFQSKENDFKDGDFLIVVPKNSRVG